MELQELRQFEQEAIVCTWMTDQLVENNLEIQICEFLDFLQEFDLNFGLWFT
jgi:hypothetical protein